MREELAEAMRLCGQAARSPDPDERRELAERALELTEDCAEAHSLLAIDAFERGDEEEPAVRGLHDRAVAAGLRAVGRGRVIEYAGRLHSLPEGASYLRALHHRAFFLQETGHTDAAVEDAREVLRLDELDHLGVRFALSGWLIGADRDGEAEGIIDSLEPLSGMPDSQSEREILPYWLYHKALLAYRRRGPDADERLRQAHEASPAFSHFLLGERPVQSLEGLSLLDWMLRKEEGEADPDTREAEEYARENGHLWEDTDGALGWLFRIRPYSGWANLWVGFPVSTEDPPAQALRAGVEVLLHDRAADRGLTTGLDEEAWRLHEERRFVVSGTPESIYALIEDLKASGLHDFVVDAGSPEEVAALADIHEEVRLHRVPGEFPQPGPPPAAEPVDPQGPWPRNCPACGGETFAADVERRDVVVLDAEGGWREHDGSARASGARCLRCGTEVASSSEMGYLVDRIVTEEAEARERAASEDGGGGEDDGG